VQLEDLVAVVVAVVAATAMVQESEEPEGLAAAAAAVRARTMQLRPEAQEELLLLAAEQGGMEVARALLPVAAVEVVARLEGLPLLAMEGR
jgi:hypothetical protein